MNESHAAEIIRRYYGAYESKDKEALEGLLSDDFMFSSPHDDRINQQTYFAKCWPFSEKVRAFHLERIAEDGDKVFVLYECEPANGVTFRNVEVFRIEHGKVKEVVVYFGQDAGRVGRIRRRRDSQTCGQTPGSYSRQRRRGCHIDGGARLHPVRRGGTAAINRRECVKKTGRRMVLYLSGSDRLRDS